MLAYTYKACEFYPQYYINCGLTFSGFVSLVIHLSFLSILLRVVGGGGVLVLLLTNSATTKDQIQGFELVHPDIYSVSEFWSTGRGVAL